jgi:hypothetical protein
MDDVELDLSATALALEVQGSPAYRLARALPEGSWDPDQARAKFRKKTCTLRLTLPARL